MGKINNYSVETVNPGDRVLCSDESTGQTKNVTAQSISDLASSSSVYRAYITQSGVTAPVATVLPGNTLTGTWVYNGVGLYTFENEGAFAGLKVAVMSSLPQSATTRIAFNGADDDKVYLSTYVTSTLTNALMTNQYIEIFTHDI
jgi:hypothetical protein